MTTRLIYKSALVRLGTSPRVLDRPTRMERGLAAISTVTRLEVGYSHGRPVTSLGHWTCPRWPP